MIRRLTFIAAALVLSGAASSAQTPVAQLVPEDTLLHIEVSGEPCTRASADLALAKILDEPEVRAFGKPLGGMLAVAKTGAVMQLQAMTGLGAEVLDLVQRGRFTASFTGIQTFQTTSTYEMNGEVHEYTSSTVMPKMIATLEYTHIEGVLDDTVQQLEELLLSFAGNEVALSSVTVDGQQVSRLSDASGNVPVEILYFVEHGRLIVASDRELLSGFLRRSSGQLTGSLASHADFRASADRTFKKNSVVFAYADIQAILALVASESGEDDFTGLAAMLPYRTLSYGMDLDGPGFRDRFYYTLMPGSMLAEMFNSGQPLRTHRMLPADTGLAFGYSMQLDAAWDASIGMLEQLNPGGSGSMQRGIQEAEQVLGMSIRDDLLPALGPELAGFASFQGSALIPDFGLIVQVRDKEKIAGLLQHVFGNVTQTGVRQVGFRGQAIHYTEVPTPGTFFGQDGALRPSWTFVDDFLVFTLWPQAAKNLIAGMQDGQPRLADNADFKRLRAAYGGGRNRQLNSYTYIDMKSAAAFVLDNGTPFLQSMVPTGGPVPLEIAAWPTTQSITKHLFGMFGASHMEDNGVYAEIYSPTGVMLPYMLSVAAVVATFAVRSEEMMMPAQAYTDEEF